MVAPTRTPQVRGVKCQLCNKILAQATWIDQTKLAKSVEDAQTVLDFITKHSAQGCLCMPKNIENLLIGSTHFEIHRLLSRQLDATVHRGQVEYFQEQFKLKQSKTVSINDCTDSLNQFSRFRLLPQNVDQKFHKSSKLQMISLCRAIDYWRTAVHDQISLFNSKLALRLGLTHHSIYACYLFKYHKMLHYQLISADLVLNLFKLIEGVTPNAQMHAYFLLIRTLIDCEQYSLAKQYLKQSTRIANFQDKSHYESILLTCVFSELNLIDESDPCNTLDELATLGAFQPDDKLQHYYARTLVLTTLIKYLQYYEKCNELCFEFYKAFRYLSAIIRRCFESSFELILRDKDSKNVKPQNGSSSDQILQHGWIKYAACDFVFSSFDLLVDFYLKTGQPESVELLYNSLNLIAYRTTSYFWQMRMLSLGAKLDSICNKYKHVRLKQDAMTQILSYAKDSHLITMMKLDLEVSLVSENGHEKKTKEETVLDLLDRLKKCRVCILKETEGLELYDCNSSNSLKLTPALETDTIVIKGYLGNLSIQALTAGILSANLHEKNHSSLMKELVDILEASDKLALEYHIYQSLLEIILITLGINKSEELLLNSIKGSKLFLDDLSSVDLLETQISKLSLNGKTTRANHHNRKPVKTKSKVVTTLRKSRRKGTYNVAEVAQENLSDLNLVGQPSNRPKALKNLMSLSTEEKLLAYLRLSGPNPDYLLYRKANEMLLGIYLEQHQQEGTQHSHEKLLFHFVESISANTFRYRWMMFEEALASSRDAKKGADSSLRYLSFVRDADKSEKEVREFLKTIPAGYRMVQLKFMVDQATQSQHLVAACFDRDSHGIFFVNCRKPIIPESFLDGLGSKKSDDTQEDQLLKSTLPRQLESKLEEAKATLFLNSHTSRSEARRRLETDIGLILYDLENDWLGAYRFILCGEIEDADFRGSSAKICQDIQRIFSATSACRSTRALGLLVSNGAGLERAEFRLVLAKLFDCSPTSAQVDEAYNCWHNSLKSYISQQTPCLDKNSLLASFKRNQLGVVLDKHLEKVPLESLPLLRLTNQGLFRVPSLRLLSVMRSRVKCQAATQVDTSECAYILDPANNLARTREKFEAKLKAQAGWLGVVNRPPEVGHLEQWLLSRHIYIFIGHGAGVVYYNSLCKGRGLSAMPSLKASSIVMGCSSGRMTAEGPRLESFGIGWVFALKSCASYVGLLWDVTDTDIDKFLDRLLELWMPDRWNNSSFSSNGSQSIHLLTDAVAKARHVCQYTFLVGSTPVVYGLPVSSSIHRQSPLKNL